VVIDVLEREIDVGGLPLEEPINGTILTDFDICPWRPLKDGKKLARRYKLMTPGLEVGVGLVNRTEHPGVGVFEKLDIDIS